ncbi:glyoxalase [Aquihabitans sp. G128]|uniref:VOC family protein n=1 Tax=Aquihabitans sp. G128 TaxID=2849779 RepID=UPI001C22F732|nr:VOC family protein [Aquihabitans sp. G128]QXC60709.1 glyoxalase [Aquihabitans sp. G128]
MDFKLELVVVPVSDVGRAKDFYVDQVGFEVHVDFKRDEDFRVVQLHPKGSGCSISIGTGISAMEPGSLKGLHLVVTDIVAAREELVGRGVPASEPYHFGPEGQQPGLDPNRASYGTFLDFADPDGNLWLVQEVTVPTPRD